MTREPASTQHNDPQRELPILSLTRKPERIPSHLVALCGSAQEALRLAQQYGKKSQQQVANALGIEKSQWSRILSGLANFPANKARAFAYCVGNWGWQQWVAFDAGMDLVPRSESTEERMARLEAENAELRASAA
jgi:transcriptional regulator with XRE-family HTH domain